MSEIVVNETSPEEDSGTELDQEVELQESTPEIPSKYQGKSLEDIVKMHEEAEKAISRQGNELGEVRKLADQLLQAELNRTVPTADTKEEADWDFSPEEAAKTLVTKEVGSVKSELDKLKQERALEKFANRHPGYQEEAQSPEFKEWVEASQYRINLYNKANDLDLEAAEDLFAGWEDVKPVAEDKSDEDAKRKQDLKAASMEKGASSGGSKKKIWSRAAIINMRLYDRAKYEEHRDEIMLAYAEKRVKP